MLNNYTSADSLYDILFNEGMEHVVSEGYDDLTETELSKIRELFDDNFDIGALGRYIAEEYLFGYADDIIENRTKVYEVDFMLTLRKTIRIRAHSDDEIEGMLNCGWEFSDDIADNIRDSFDDEELDIVDVKETDYENSDFDTEEYGI